MHYKMPEFFQTYNFNSLYVCLLLLLYNVFNYEHINIIASKLYLLNRDSLLIMINIIGLYLFLKKITFEIKLSIKCNHL